MNIFNRMMGGAPTQKTESKEGGSGVPIKTLIAGLAFLTFAAGEAKGQAPVKNHFRHEMDNSFAGKERRFNDSEVLYNTYKLYMKYAGVNPTIKPFNEKDFGLKAQEYNQKILGEIQENRTKAEVRLAADLKNEKITPAEYQTSMKILGELSLSEKAGSQAIHAISKEREENAKEANLGNNDRRFESTGKLFIQGITPDGEVIIDGQAYPLFEHKPVKPEPSQEYFQTQPRWFPVYGPKGGYLGTMSEKGNLIPAADTRHLTDGVGAHSEDLELINKLKGLTTPTGHAITDLEETKMVIAGGNYGNGIALDEHGEPRNKEEANQNPEALKKDQTEFKKYQAVYDFSNYLKSQYGVDHVELGSKEINMDDPMMAPFKKLQEQMVVLSNTPTESTTGTHTIEKDILENFLKEVNALPTKLTETQYNTLDALRKTIFVMTGDRETKLNFDLPQTLFDPISAAIEAKRPSNEK